MRREQKPSIHRILAAVKDLRAASMPAVLKGAQLARALRCPLRLFHGIEEPIYMDMAQSDARPVAQIKRERYESCSKRLEAIAARLRRRGIDVTTAVEWDFPAYEAILRNAKEFRADLIVAECHATRHRAPWLLRFTDWELLRMSAVPVLLVKSRKPYHRPRVLAAVDPTHAFAKPTNLDAQILRHGSTVSAALGGALHAVHAYDPIPIDMMTAMPSSAGAVAKIETRITARAEHALESILKVTPIPAQRRHLIGRHPLDAIAEAAAATHSTILVMGAVARSGLKRVFIGNTAEKLLDRLPCDFLIVKPRRFPSHVRTARRGPQLVTLPVIQPGL